MSYPRAALRAPSGVFLYFKFLKRDLAFNISLKLAYGNSYLLHGISVTNGYATVGLGVKVVGNAKRSTDLVLTAVSLTDGACLVVVNVKILAEVVKYLLCALGKLLGKRKHRCLEGSEERMQVKHRSYVVLFCINDFFVVSVNEECKSYAVSSERRLNYVRNVLFVGLGIEVHHILTAVLCVL